MQKRMDLYLSTLREYIERKGGKLWLRVTFPDQPPVILAGLGGDSSRKKAKKKAGNGAQIQGQNAPRRLSGAQVFNWNRQKPYKFKQNKDLFALFALLKRRLKA